VNRWEVRVDFTGTALAVVERVVRELCTALEMGGNTPVVEQDGIRVRVRTENKKTARTTCEWMLDFWNPIAVHAEKLYCVRDNNGDGYCATCARDPWALCLNPITTEL